MKKIYTFIIFCLLSAQVFSQACDSLYSPCIGTFSRNGYYFNLQALSDVNVTSFSVMVQNGGSRDVSVYYRKGTYAGFEGVSGNWTLLGTHTSFNPVTALSCPIPTNKINVDLSICIPQGQVYGFYLVMSSGTGTFEGSNGSAEGTTVVQDSKLKLINGKGQQGIGDFSGILTTGISFQGAIKYNCSTCATAVSEQINTMPASVFPMPVQNTINFSGVNNPASVKRVEIYNLTGKLVYVSGKTTFDVSALAGGMYMAALVMDDGNSSRIKFIKE